jgi:hypothetical protein
MAVKDLKKVGLCGIFVKIDLTFDDKYLEQCRQELLSLLQEKTHNQRTAISADPQYHRANTAHRSRQYGGKPCVSQVGKKRRQQVKTVCESCPNSV